jgi:protein ImuB
MEGLTLVQAMARASDLVIRRRSMAQEAATMDLVLQIACAFTPNIELTSPGVVTLDLRGLLELRDAGPKEFTAWANRLHQILSAAQLSSRLGIGPTPNLARHASRWGDGIFQIVDPDSFIKGLPVAALEPSSDVADILSKWGIRTVGELLALGQGEVTERLGLEAFALFAAASSRQIRPLALTKPPERYEESFEFEEPVETVEPLHFLLRRWVDQFTQRLDLIGLVAETLTLRLRLESGDSLDRRLPVPQPTRQADILFRMLQTCLETLRTESPIRSVELKADPTRPRQKQFMLFEAALRDPHQFQETLARLSALVGSDRVGTPVRENSHRPDTFKMVPPDFENLPDRLAHRTVEILRRTPVRQLRPAVAAQVVTAPGTRAEGVAVPVSVRAPIITGNPIRVQGPWRLSGQWWDPAAWTREEWELEFRNGVVCRLSRDDTKWTAESLLD